MTTGTLAAAPGPAAAPEDRQRLERDQRLAQWLAAAAGGDSTAFERFYDGSFALARSVARRVLRGQPPEAVDDLLADAYFEAWRNAARFDATRGTALTWLLTLVRSRAIDALRAIASHPSVGGSGDDPEAEVLDTAPDVLEQLWQRQTHARLAAALAELSAPERWVLGLAYWRELSQTEIAQATGLPLGTVKSHALRAQAKLRAALAAG
jgi:RNA polymerase sigma-70 factor, ECF subfamily